MKIWYWRIVTRCAKNFVWGFILGMIAWLMFQTVPVEASEMPEQQTVEPVQRRADDTGISDAAWPVVGSIGVALIGLAGIVVAAKVNSTKKGSKENG